MSSMSSYWRHRVMRVQALSQEEYEIIDKVVNIINSLLLSRTACLHARRDVLWIHSYSGGTSLCIIRICTKIAIESGRLVRVPRENDYDIWKGRQRVYPCGQCEAINMSAASANYKGSWDGGWAWWTRVDNKWVYLIRALKHPLAWWPREMWYAPLTHIRVVHFCVSAGKTYVL